jgi:hypothetical protein
VDDELAGPLTAVGWLALKQDLSDRFDRHAAHYELLAERERKRLVVHQPDMNMTVSLLISTGLVIRNRGRSRSLWR